MKMLGHKSFTAVLLIALIFVIAAGYSLSVYQQKDSNIEIYKTELKVLTEQKAAQVNQYLESKAGELDILMSFDEFAEVLKDPTNNAKIAQAQGRINELKDIIPGICLLTNAGIVIVADIDLPGTDYSAQPYFSMEEKALTFERYYDPLRKNDYYAAVSPFYDRQNTEEIIGTIAIDVPFEYFNVILASGNETITREFYLVDKDRIVITSTIFGYTPFAQEADTEGIADCFACLEENTVDGDITEHEESVSQYIDYRGVAVLGTHAHLPLINACLIGEMDKAEMVRLSGGGNIFSELNRIIKNNRTAVSSIYLLLSILIIWTVSTLMIVKNKVIKYIPLLVIGIVVCLHAGYALLVDRQNTGLLQVFQMSTFLVNTILLIVIGGQVASVRLLRTHEGMTRRYTVLMSILAALAVTLMGLESYFHFSDSGASIAEWVHLFINILLVLYVWWLVYLLQEQLHRLSMWFLLFFSALILAVVVPVFYMDNDLIEWLYAIALTGALISAYFLVVHRMADIMKKFRATNEV